MLRINRIIEGELYNIRENQNRANFVVHQQQLTFPPLLRTNS